MKYVLGALLAMAVVFWFVALISIETGYKPRAGCDPGKPGGVHCSDRYLGLEANR